MNLLFHHAQCSDKEVQGAAPWKAKHIQPAGDFHNSSFFKLNNPNNYPKNLIAS